MALSKTSSLNGLSKKATAPAHNARAHLGIAMGRDEDERNGAIDRRQLPLERQAANPRHPHVDDEAGRVLQMPGVPRVLRRGERFSSEPHGSDETLDSLADGLVIVDNRGKGNLRHAGPRTPGAVLRARMVFCSSTVPLPRLAMPPPPTMSPAVTPLRCGD
jgi:hypothetical protein